MTLHDDDDLAALAKQLDLPAPDEPRIEAIRASLLRSAVDDQRAPKPRWPFVAGGFTAGAFAAAASAMVVMHTGHPSSPIAAAHAQIDASGSADFDRQVVHGLTGTDEVVRLHTGKLALSIGALAAGDRVRVAVKNGEIEGEGRYEVEVADDLLRSVTVQDGTARIRITGQHDVILAAGQVWKGPVVTADVITSQTPPSPPPPPAPVPSPSIAPTTIHGESTTTRSTSPSRSTLSPDPQLTPHREAIALAPKANESPAEHAATPSVPAMQTMADASPNEAPPAAITQIPKTKISTTPIEQHFAAGWQLLRAGKNAEAARELAAAADAGGDDPLAGDARYFEAVALTKAGRKTEAEHALVEFLDRSPHALRRGRAAVMLARLISERGDRVAARTWFEAASHDSDPDVAAAAKAGLSLP